MMVLNVQLGDVGLILDLAGVILLFFFGLAPLLSKDGSMSLSVGSSEYLKRKAKRYEVLSRLGVFLIAIGFALQLAGNHITSSLNIGIDTLIIAAITGLLFGLGFWTVNTIRGSKYDFTAQYVPQFDESKPSHGGDHMWSFSFTNNSKQEIKSCTLHLSGTPRTALVIVQGRKPNTIKKTSDKVDVSEVPAGKQVVIRVWNIAGYKEAGLDCYLNINGKIIRPRVHHSDGL